MAACVFDDAPAPPDLVMGWDLERFGGDVTQLPPGALRAVKTALYAYEALHGYKASAPNTNAWIARNPEPYEFVTRVLAARKAAQNA